MPDANIAAMSINEALHFWCWMVHAQSCATVCWKWKPTYHNICILNSLLIVSHAIGVSYKTAGSILIEPFTNMDDLFGIMHPYSNNMLSNNMSMCIEVQRQMQTICHATIVILTKIIVKRHANAGAVPEKAMGGEGGK